MPSDDTETTRQRPGTPDRQPDDRSRTTDSTTGPTPVGGSRSDTLSDPRIDRARADAIFQAMRTGSTTRDLQQRFGDDVTSTPEGRDAAERAARMRASRSRQRQAVQEADSHEAGTTSQSTETRGQRANRRAREAGRRGQDQGLGR